MKHARCAGCGRFTDKVHIDHIHPKSRGGTDDPENLQLLCDKCNLSKSWKTMREWVLVPNARCRSFWAGREHLAPVGKAHDQGILEIFDPVTLIDGVDRISLSKSMGLPRLPKGKRRGPYGDFKHLAHSST